MNRLYIYFLIALVFYTQIALCEETAETNWGEIGESVASLNISKSDLENHLIVGNEEGYYQDIIDIYLTLDEKYKTPSVLNEVGVAYFHLGENGKAIELFEKAVELDPLYGEPYANLGVIYRVKGRFDEAREFEENALSLLDSNPTLYFNLGVLYNRLGEVKLEEEMYRRAIEEDEGYAPAYERLALFLLEMERYEEAMDIVRRYSQLEGVAEDVLTLIKDISKKTSSEEK